MDAGNRADNPTVVYEGTIKEARTGPAIGQVDIGVSNDAYLFRVALPGIRNDRSNLQFEIKSDGKVCIKGVVPDSDVIKPSSTVSIKVQQLCEPGPFTISFNLPGPVDPRLAQPTFRPDGILEVVVMKYKRGVNIPPCEHHLWDETSINMPGA